jgi:hypothetical protein
MEAIGFSEIQFLKEPHGVTFQKMTFFIVIAVIISNLRDYRFKNGVFWDVTPCGSCKFLRSVGSYKSHTALHPRRRDSP